MEWCELTILAGASSLSVVSNVIYSTNSRAQRRVSRGYTEHRHVNHPRFNLLPLPEVMGYGYLNKRPTFFTHPVYPHDTFSQRDSYTWDEFVVNNLLDIKWLLLTTQIGVMLHCSSAVIGAVVRCFGDESLLFHLSNTSCCVHWQLQSGHRS